ncbi:hypothetical protein [Sinomonas sp. G460-2]|uniref:hypothetical protein n=1 Tax=Sinomonas sp. G460-2 TaxID=3393464 RepID=UPI0039F079F3
MRLRFLVSRGDLPQGSGRRALSTKAESAEGRLWGELAHVHVGAGRGTLKITGLSVLWFATTAASIALASFAFHFPGSLPPGNGDEFVPQGVVGAAIHGGATGLVVGGLQAFLLRRAGRSGGRWLALTVLALFLGHAVADVLPDAYGLPVVATMGGFALGAAQWLAADWPLRIGSAWMAVTGTAWAVAMWAAYEAGRTMPDWRIEHLIIGGAVGVSLGASTAALWLWRPIRETASAGRPRQGATGRTGTP